MTPVSPVFPGSSLPEVTFTGPGYLPCPAHRDAEGKVTTRWRLTWRERISVLLAGHIWLKVLTFNGPLQPLKLLATQPTLEE